MRGMNSLTALIALSLLAVTSLTCAQPAKPAAAITPAAKPEDFVLRLYAEHAAGRGPLGGDPITEAGLRAWFAPGFATLLWKEIQASKEEPGKLDFDVFYNAQDVQITKLRVTSVKTTDASAAVSVTFRNYDHDESIRLHLRRATGGAWRVARG